MKNHCLQHARRIFFLHTETFCTQTLSHTDTFTLSTGKLLRRRFDTDAFTQMLLHRCFYTQKPSHTHRSFVHTPKKKLGFLKSVFGYRPSVRAKGLQLSFWRSNLISCERVARDDLNELALLPSFLRSNLISCKRVAAGALEPRFVQKGLRGTPSNRIFTVVFGQCQRNGTSNPFARNEVLSPKTELKFRFQLVRGNPFARNEIR